MNKHSLKIRERDQISNEWLTEVIQSGECPKFWRVDQESIDFGWSDNLLIKRVYETEIFQELMRK